MWGKNKQKPAANIHFDTLIAEGTWIKGSVEFKGGLHIDGAVKGDIRAAEESNAVVRLSEAARIEGDVIAPHVIVNGRVNGDVYASEHLELAANASITGNVYYSLIEMVMGAEVNGSLVHDKELAVEKLALGNSDVPSPEKTLAAVGYHPTEKRDPVAEIESPPSDQAVNS